MVKHDKNEEEVVVTYGQGLVRLCGRVWEVACACIEEQGLFHLHYRCTCTRGGRGEEVVDEEEAVEFLVSGAACGCNTDNRLYCYGWRSKWV